MEVVALVVSVLSLLLAGIALLRSEWRWRAERGREVRVLARHDATGIDAYGDREEVEYVVVVQVHNLGERSEHVMEIGIESPSGEPIADDRPSAARIVDEPLPEGRELPPRGQIGGQFKVLPEAIAGGFIGYAVLGTGERAYSEFAVPDKGLDDIEATVRGVFEEVASKGVPGDEDKK